MQTQIQKVDLPWKEKMVSIGRKEEAGSGLLNPSALQKRKSCYQMAWEIF